MKSLYLINKEGKLSITTEGTKKELLVTIHNDELLAAVKRSIEYHYIDQGHQLHCDNKKVVKYKRSDLERLKFTNGKVIKDSNGDIYYSVREIAETFSISRDTVSSAIETGKPIKKLGNLSFYWSKIKK